MATSTVALGKVEISQRRGTEIPNTWGVNEQGSITEECHLWNLIVYGFVLGIPVTKPENVRGLLALGGPEESSGYKGYGLSMMVETLCGILSGK
mgnify:CR=1 FL=1